jgi:hypothetical protein
VLRFGILLVAFRVLGLRIGIVALGIERRLSAMGRSQGDLGSGIMENVVWGCEFLQPESCFLAGISQFAVRSKNHQNFHSLSSFTQNKLFPGRF